MEVVLNLTDKTQKRVKAEITDRNGILYAGMPEKVDYTNVKSVDFAVDYAKAQAGEAGYYVLPRGREGLGDDSLCYFTEREDCEVVIEGPEMTMYGMIGENYSFMAAVTGMTYDYELVVRAEKGVYTMFPRFILNGQTPYEKIEVRFETLSKGADYNAVAHAYRRYRFEKGEIVPLKERMKRQKVLERAAKAPFIRIRMGWKPVPTPVEEQTQESEPPMKVACTFEDVEKLMEECYAQGIRDAEFCLVGWNVRGHDGRWPQIFPVEEAFGGEEALKKLIDKAGQLGYLIVCHTNSTDAYSIAENYNEKDLIQKADGSVSRNKTSWSGGAMYDLCPAVAKKQAEEMLPRVAALGFSGLHYIDVISTVPPRTCYSPEHPVTARQCVEQWLDIMRLSKELFGGFSSEGGYDFAAPQMDYGLYVSFGDKGCPLSDKKVPLWQLVYHGFVMGNPFATTVNPDDEDWLKVMEYGGRPAIYFYSQFVTPDGERGNWMGTVDYACHTQEERKESVSRIAKTCRAYAEAAYLQKELMEEHRETAPGVFEVTYSDDSRVIVDYHIKSWQIIKGQDA